MENGGNAKVNAIFEAHLDNPSTKPSAGASGPVRERFIRDKYERRKYYDPLVLQNYTSISPPQSNPAVTSSAAAAPVSSTRRSPSEAAKLRALSRKSKSLPIESWSATKNTPAAAPVPHSNSEVDLLDFSAPPITDLGSPPNPPSATPSPTLDMFKNMSIAMCGGGVASADQGAAGANPTSSHNGTNKNSSLPKETGKKMTSDDILAMFHAPSIPQQQQFGNFSHFNSMNHAVSGGGMNMNMMNMNSSSGNMGGGSSMGMMYAQNQTMMQQPQQQMNLFAGMQHQQNHMMGMSGGTSSLNSHMAMGRNQSENNSFGMNQEMMYNYQQQQQQPMGGNPSNLNMMGGSSMTQPYNQNVGLNSMGNQGYQGSVDFKNNGNGRNGSDNLFGDVMGGASNNQHQFASFGSFH